MKPTQLPKALFILFLFVIAAVGVFYFIAPPAVFTKFDTSYADYPDPLPAPHADPESVIEVPGLIRTFDITQAGDKIAIATSKEILIYDLNSLERIHSYPISEDIARILFSPDGSKLALSTSDTTHYQNGPANTIVIDADTSAPLYSHQNDPEYYSFGSIVWSPDSEQIAFSIPDRGLSIIDVATGENTTTLKDFFETPIDISWSPDGSRILATGDYGNGIRRWRLDTDQWVRLWDAQLQPASQVKWSPDGKRIASGHYGGMVCIWNVGNNSCEGKIQAHFNWVGALDWSPDSKQVASASGAIRIWDASNGDMKSAFGYDGEIIYDRLHWVDPQTIATLETSYTLKVPTMIRFWDASTGKVKLAFRGWDVAQVANAGGVMPVLDDVQIGSDHTQLQVSLRFDMPELSPAGLWSVTMIDSQGRIYPLTDITPPNMDNNLTRVYRTAPLPVGERITLDLVSFPPNQGFPLMVDVSVNPGSFSFDPGILEVGESIPQDIEIDANGWYLHLTSVQRTTPTELAFEFDKESIYEGIMLYAPQASMSTSKPLENEKVVALLAFPQLPEEAIKIEVQKITYRIPGSWSLDFQVAKSMFAELPPLTEEEPNLASAPEPVFTSQAPLFLEVKTLVENYQRSVVQEGWVYMASEVVTENIQPGQSYPPPYYKEEQWSEVDKEGWVLRNLTTHFDKAGNILQQSVSVGAQGFNLSTGELMENPEYKLSFDWILSDLDYALNNGHAITREDGACDDVSPCLVITLRDGNFGRRVWIGAETGQLVKLQAVEYLENGTEVIQITQTFSPAEWTESPPREVLDMFEKVIFPSP